MFEQPSQLSGGIAGAQQNAIDKEPTLCGRVEELRKYLEEWASHHRAIREVLLGAQPTDPATAAKPVTVDQKLLVMCQFAAAMANDARMLRARL